MPRRLYEHKQIVEDRLARFEAFRVALEPEDRTALDKKLNRWCAFINQRKTRNGFGIQSAQELFIALVEFGDCTVLQ
jgi:hypothetical protein